MQSIDRLHKYIERATPDRVDKIISSLNKWLAIDLLFELEINEKIFQPK